MNSLIHHIHHIIHYDFAHGFAQHYPLHLPVVNFRLPGGDEVNARLCELICAHGNVYLTTTRLREGDSVLAAFAGSTRATCVFFTNFGVAYTCRIIDVPASTGYGEPIQKQFKLKDGEKVVAAMSLDARAAGDGVAEVGLFEDFGEAGAGAAVGEELVGLEAGAFGAVDDVEEAEFEGVGHGHSKEQIPGTGICSF